MIENGLRSLIKTEKVPGARRVAAGLAAAMAILSVSVVFSSACYVFAGSASVFGLGMEYDLFPHSASRVIARSDFPARAVNLAQDGGFLVWEHPGRPIFVDQRANLYGAEFYLALNKCLAGEADAWKAILEKWDPDAVIMNCSIPFAANAVRCLLQFPSWALVYFDGTTAILVRAVSENQALIRDVQIQKAGLELIEKERLRAMNAAGYRVPPRLIGAGEMFFALGRYGEAESVYSALTRCAPMMGRAWMNRGIAQMEQGKAQDAVKTLRRACEVAPHEVFAWISLYRAGNRAGLADEARAAIEKAKNINLKIATLFLHSEQRAEQEGRKVPASPAQ
jgi:tetratricopeptide (TPR) repeat protein